jgi:hypothetical protein
VPSSYDLQKTKHMFSLLQNKYAFEDIGPDEDSSEVFGEFSLQEYMVSCFVPSSLCVIITYSNLLNLRKSQIMPKNRIRSIL